MNPHYANNNEPDYLSISEPNLLEFLEDEVTIGYLRKTSFQSEGKCWVYSEAPNYLSKYLTDFINFSSITQLFDDIKKIQEPLFEPLLLTLAPVLSIESEHEIVDMIMTLQD